MSYVLHPHKHICEVERCFDIITLQLLCLFWSKCPNIFPPKMQKPLVVQGFLFIEAS